MSLLKIHVKAVLLPSILYLRINLFILLSSISDGNIVSMEIYKDILIPIHGMNLFVKLMSEHKTYPVNTGWKIYNVRGIHKYIVEYTCILRCILSILYSLGMTTFNQKYGWNP